MKTTTKTEQKILDNLATFASRIVLPSDELLLLARESSKEEFQRLVAGDHLGRRIAAAGFWANVQKA